MNAQDEYAMNQKKFYGFEVRMTNNNFDEVGSKFSQNRHTLVYMYVRVILSSGLSFLQSFLDSILTPDYRMGPIFQIGCVFILLSVSACYQLQWATPAETIIANFSPNGKFRCL